MNVTVESLPDCRAILRVEVPAEDVAAQKKQAVAAYQKHARVPGYRPGKAPARLIEKQYQKEIQEESRERLVGANYRKAAEQENLEVLSADRLLESVFEPDGSFRFTVEVTLHPKVEVPDFEGIPVKTIVAEATEELVEKQLKHWQELHADHVRDEGHVLTAGDFAIVSYTATVDGQPLFDIAPEAPDGVLDSEDRWYVVGNEGDDLPGFSLELVGHKEGDTFVYTANVPAEFPALPEVAGKQVQYDVTISQARRKTLPDWDDSFAVKLLGQNKTMADLKETARSSTQMVLERRRDNEIEQQVLSWLDERVTFDLPASLVAEETQRRVNRMAKDLVQRGMPQEQLVDFQDQIIASAEGQAKGTVKARFILAEAARKAEIKVTQQDMTRVLMNICMETGKKPQVVLKELKKNGRIEVISHDIAIEKALELVKSKATIDETPLAAADFQPLEYPMGGGASAPGEHVHDENCQHDHDHDEHVHDENCDHDHDHEHGEGCDHDNEHGEHCDHDHESDNDEDEEVKTSAS